MEVSQKMIAKMISSLIIRKRESQSDKHKMKGTNSQRSNLSHPKVAKDPRSNKS